MTLEDEAFCRCSAFRGTVRSDVWPTTRSWPNRIRVAVGDVVELEDPVLLGLVVGVVLALNALTT
jgi:hypothetical protein